MEHDKALGILKILADGIDPGTGETLSPASPYQYPDTVRALYYAIRVLENPNQTRERSAAQQCIRLGHDHSGPGAGAQAQPDRDRSPAREAGQDPGRAKRNHALSGQRRRRNDERCIRQRADDVTGTPLTPTLSRKGRGRPAYSNPLLPCSPLSPCGRGIG